MANSDIYLQHFSRYFYKPFDVRTYTTEEGEQLRLATFDKAFPQFRIYASLGLSDRAEQHQGVGEVLLFSDDFRADVVDLFVNMLLFLVRKNIPLTTPFTIGGIEMLNPEFADYYDKAGLYFSKAHGIPDSINKDAAHRELGRTYRKIDPQAWEAFTKVRCGYDLGEVYQALFVSYGEMDLVNRGSTEELEARLRAQDQDQAKMYSLSRPSCV